MYESKKRRSDAALGSVLPGPGVLHGQTALSQAGNVVHYTTTIDNGSPVETACKRLGQNDLEKPGNSHSLIKLGHHDDSSSRIHVGF